MIGAPDPAPTTPRMVAPVQLQLLLQSSSHHRKSDRPKAPAAFSRTPTQREVHVKLPQELLSPATPTQREVHRVATDRRHKFHVVAVRASTGLLVLHFKNHQAVRIFDQVVY